MAKGQSKTLGDVCFMKSIGFIGYMKENPWTLSAALLGVAAFSLIARPDIAELGSDKLHWILGAGVQTMGSLLGLLLVGITYLRTRVDVVVESRIAGDVLELWRKIGIPYWGWLRQAYFEQNPGAWVDDVDALDSLAWGDRIPEIKDRISPPPRVTSSQMGVRLLGSPAQLASSLRAIVNHVDMEVFREMPGIPNGAREEVIALVRDLKGCFSRIDPYVSSAIAANAMVSSWKTAATAGSMVYAIVLGLLLLFMPSVSPIAIKVFAAIFFASTILLLNLLESVIHLTRI